MAILTQLLFWAVVYFVIIIASWAIDAIWESTDSGLHFRFENFKKKFRGYL
jgi:hypothetical protein